MLFAPLVIPCMSCCFEHANDEFRIRYCCHVAYPHHPQHVHRQPCGVPLLKKVKSSKRQASTNEGVSFMPIHKSLQALAMTPEFISACERWRDRTNSIYMMVRYGMISKHLTFLVVLSHTQCWLVSAISWYSIFSWDLTIKNLPHNIRCK